MKIRRLLGWLAFGYAAMTWLQAAEPPRDLGDAPGAALAIGPAVMLPDGTIESYSRRGSANSTKLFKTVSRDEGRTWSKLEPVADLGPGGWGGPMPLLDHEGELHIVIPLRRGTGVKPAVDRFVDLWHMKTSEGRSRWSEPVRIYEGYCGSLQGIYQMKNGRILVPFADWLPGVRTAPPSGPSVTTMVYSDDGGRTWVRSPAALTSPCYPDYNGSNYGACEPTVIELNDGRVWMLIRTQTGQLYESFSTNGADWSEAKPSTFFSSNSPAFPVRLPDGRLVLFWNNALPPPRHGKVIVYGGRDALHAAISDDDGKTWKGFREVYRDPTRHSTPPKTGDRGTAYPHATVTKSGKVLLVSGQGAGLRRRFLIDPDWLLEKSQAETFANLDAWHVFRGFGPAHRAWRDREVSAHLMPHPEQPGASVLRVRRPTDREADGAVWNFPAGRVGRIALRLQIPEGSSGAQLSLTDKLFDPCDDRGEKTAAFAVTFEGERRLPPGWHNVEIYWDTIRGRGALRVNEGAMLPLPQLQPSVHGMSYLRIRATARGGDEAGILISAASVILP